MSMRKHWHWLAVGPWGGELFVNTGGTSAYHVISVR